MSSAVARDKRADMEEKSTRILESVVKFDRDIELRLNSDDIHQFVFEWYQELNSDRLKSVDHTEARRLSDVIALYAEALAHCYKKIRGNCHLKINRHNVDIARNSYKGMSILDHIIVINRSAYDMRGLAPEDLNRAKVNASYVILNYFQGAYWSRGIYKEMEKILKEVIRSDKATPTKLLPLAFLNLGVIYLNEWGGLSNEAEGIIFLNMAIKHGDDEIKRLAKYNIKKHFAPPATDSQGLPCLMPPWTRGGFWMRAWGGCN